MLPDDTRIKIKNITAGVVLDGQAGHCAAVRNLLCQRFETSSAVKREFERNAVIKEEQRFLIEQFASQNNLWFETLPSSYLTEGGEARIFLDGDTHVLKINDGGYYATWLEFFNSVLLHNIIFENTEYDLQGFWAEHGNLHVVLRQPFIQVTSHVNLLDVRKFLLFNGFRPTRRHDYFHSEFGLILEDMHDENVLVNDDVLFFIDTVFYTVSPEKPV